MSQAFSALSDLQSRYAHAAVALHAAVVEEPTWRGASIGIAGVPLVMAHRDMETIIALPPLTRIPGTRNWVLGVAAYQGGLLPILCGDTLFGERLAPGRRREYCLVVRQPGFHVGLTLSHVHGNIALPLAQRTANMPLAGLFADCCDGGFWQGERFLGLLDCTLLTASGALADTSASPAAPVEDSLLRVKPSCSFCWGCCC